jgi:hypothetical protein
MQNQPKDIKQQIASKKFLKDYVPMWKASVPYFFKKIPPYPAEALTMMSDYETICMKYCLN